ncbi:MAG: hypothetical protein QNK42_12820 [Pseudodonghicola sp.]|nr:hypothetical protein [Pseudodonghicola sp.]
MRDAIKSIAFLEGLTDQAFLTKPDHADLWPEDHPIKINRAAP